MKVVLFSTAALAAISCSSAFAPSPQQSKTRSLALNSAIAATTLPDPYKNLPWNTEREEKKIQRRLTIENASLFRELGLPEDATYEDVAAKTKYLIELTAELPKIEAIKKKIKVEIARDKIYQIRLNERIAGVRTEQDDAARVQKWEEEGLDGLIAMTTDSVDDIVKPKKKLRIPVISGLVEYIQSVIVQPDDAWRKRQIIVWGASTLVCLVVPTLTEGFARVNWLPAGGMMGYRGMPGMKDTGNGYNPFRGKRNKAHQIQAIGIAVLGWIVAKSVGQNVVASVPALAASRSAEWFKFALVQGMMGTLCLYIQTYKEDAIGKDLMV
eukprot:CAMPEP_0201884094 /NCGR_PEP_ID=MMETSP0902-20130614/16467_1 /ASSEMBLY_ACC=CAM_ASM_000551 /TAXON_ID=420261 /ORGANISM="Thalassiosira antarctica, Strain CCMP982" /LENGTH=325 /DNA_ID=CAMNT_0048412985 /DNA_START=61 /DNA_END=1038 /DNA_ORIENTATION=-